MSLKISAIEIKNIGCIEHQSINPDILTIIEGRNATGKSTIINALRYLVDTGHDPSLLRKGAQEGSIKVTFSDGVTAAATLTLERTVRVARHPQFGVISKVKEWIKSIINAISFDPARFLTAKPAERLTIFLENLPIKLEASQLGFLPVQFTKGIDLGKHPLEVIGTKTSGLYGAVYKERTRINGLAEDKRSTAAEMERSLTPDPEEGDWSETYSKKAAELTELRSDTQIKVSSIKVDAEKAIDAQEALYLETSAQLDKELAEAIEKLRADTEMARRNAQEKRDAAFRNIAQHRDAALDSAKAAYEPKNQALITEISEARTMIEQRSKTAAARELITRLSTEATQYKEKSEQLTAALKQLEALKTSLLQTLPIEGMEIEDGKLLVNGIEFDRLNDAEKHRIAVEIMRLNQGELGLMVLDRAEIFDSASWESFKTACKKAGVPIIATRVTDSDLTITTEGKEVA